MPLATGKNVDKDFHFFPTAIPAGSTVLTFISGQRCLKAQHHHIFQVQSASVNQGDGTGFFDAAATVNCVPGMFVGSQNRLALVGCFSTNFRHRSHLNKRAMTLYISGQKGKVEFCM